MSVASVYLAEADQKVRRVGWIALTLLVACEVVFLLGPTIITVIISLGKSPIVQFPPTEISVVWYELVASSSQWTVPALTSLVAASLVMVLGTTIGVAASFAIVRSGIRFRSAATSLLLLPLITPAMLISLGLALVMTSLRLAGTMEGLVIAQGVTAVPYVIVNCAISLRNIDRSVEWAAQSLGASPTRTLLHITVPLMRRGLIAAAMFAFLASWDDAIIALFLNGPSLTTLPVFLLGQASQNPSPAIAAAAGYLSVVALLVFALVVSAGMGIPTTGGRRSRADETVRR